MDSITSSAHENAIPKNSLIFLEVSNSINDGVVVGERSEGYMCIPYGKYTWGSEETQDFFKYIEDELNGKELNDISKIKTFKIITQHYEEQENILYAHGELQQTNLQLCKMKHPFSNKVSIRGKVNLKINWSIYTKEGVFLGRDIVIEDTAEEEIFSPISPRQLIARSLQRSLSAALSRD